MPLNRLSSPTEQEPSSSAYSFVTGRSQTKRKSREMPAVKVSNGSEHPPIPGRTARRINGLAHNLNNGTEPIGHVLQRTATDLGAIQKQKLKKIIDDLCDMALQEGNLMQDEFLEVFRGQQIALSMIANFIAKYRPQESQISSSELKLAQQELLSFIDSYAEDNGSSLFKFLEDLLIGYPGINIYGLFKSTPKAVSMLAKQIDKAAEDISSDYYRAKMEDDPENFLLDFIINRVTFTREHSGEMHIDEEGLAKLIRLADEAKYPLEELHTLLYNEIVRIRSTVGDAKSVIYSLRGLMKSCERLDGYPLLDNHLDYQSLWDDYFQPAIIEARRQKLTVPVRFVDSRHTRFEQMIVPKEVNEPIRAIAEDIKDDEYYIKYLRNTYDYPMPAENSGEKSSIAYLSDQEVLKTMADQLEATAAMMNNIIKTGLSRRSPKDSIHMDCEVIPEIINCTDVRKLMTWLGYPEKFIEEYPQYKSEGRRKLPHKIIAHFSRKMLEFLDLYRKYELREDRQRSKEERALAEECLCSPSFLHVRKIKPGRSPVEFRIKAEVDPRTQKLITGLSRTAIEGDNSYLHEVAQELVSPNYEAEFGRKNLGLDPTNEVILQDPESKKWFLHYPVEEKKFWETVINVNGRDIGILIYGGGDNELIHEKSTQSCVESDLRGKNPENDKKRITFVSDIEEDRDALREFFQEQHGARFEIVKDTKEQREHNKSKRSNKSDTSKEFCEKREFFGVMKLSVPVRTPDNKIIHRVITLEIQIQSLANMVITNCSDYTPSSHRRAFRPERIFEGILFKYIFPPALFGEVYSKYKSQGYRGDKKT